MCAGEASRPGSYRTPDRAPSKSVTLSTPPRRKPQPPQPSAWGTHSTGQSCPVARTPPARPPPRARRPTTPRLGQPLVVSKPAPAGGALVAAHAAAMGALVAVEQYYRNPKFSPPSDRQSVV